MAPRGEAAAAGAPTRETRVLVEIRGITRRYQEGDRVHTVLEDAHAQVVSGEFVALLGPSGSGKSTLLNLVSGIDLPDAGEVLLDGASLSGLSERERTLFRRRHLGFVFQFFNLLPTLTVLENLLLPLELNRRTGPDARLRAQALLEEVGLGERADSFPDRLSGGERQRVALARALVHDPLLVLADEPTGNLDPDTGAQVVEMLDALVRRHGKTLLAVTHSPALAARADRVWRIVHARLEEGPSTRSPRFLGAGGAAAVGRA